DTVGFIRELPHSLVAAFRATLEEVDLADILVHIVDASHPNYREQIDAVNATLSEIGIHEKPAVMVYNKSDLLSDTYELRELVAEQTFACYISALRREGVPQLMSKVTAAVESLLQHVEAVIPYDRSDIVSGCYDFGKVIRADYREDGIHIEAEVARSFARNLTPYVTSSGRIKL
ncbi:MAG: GTPase HflX, partial [Armatimonadota bacterium]